MPGYGFKPTPKQGEGVSATVPTSMRPTASTNPNRAGNPAPPARPRGKGFMQGKGKATGRPFGGVMRARMA